MGFAHALPDLRKNSPKIIRIGITFTHLPSIYCDWQETVKLLQQGNDRKNLSHCSSCQYADTQEQCPVNSKLKEINK